MTLAGAGAADQHDIIGAIHEVAADDLTGFDFAASEINEAAAEVSAASAFAPRLILLDSVCI